MTESNWADPMVDLKEANLVQLTGKVMAHPLDSKMDHQSVGQKGILKKQAMAVSSDKQMVQNLD